MAHTKIAFPHNACATVAPCKGQRRKHQKLLHHWVCQTAVVKKTRIGLDYIIHTYMYVHMHKYIHIYIYIYYHTILHYY